jgi:hypothetical protein
VVCLEAERLRQELLEATREVAVAQARLASREQDIRDKEEACLRKSLQVPPGPVSMSLWPDMVGDSCIAALLQLDESQLVCTWLHTLMREAV